jgi:hypothetical protein
MKLCLLCGREHPEAQRVCEVDGDKLIDVSERPPDLGPACDGLSPGIDLDGETVMHCPVCSDTGKVTPEQAEARERGMAAVRAVISSLLPAPSQLRQCRLRSLLHLPCRPGSNRRSGYRECRFDAGCSAGQS